VREESHLEDMRAAIRGDFERLEERRGEQALMRTAEDAVPRDVPERSTEPPPPEQSAAAEPEPEPELELELEPEPEPVVARDEAEIVEQPAHRSWLQRALGR
jgi:hypothetical protein